MVLFLSEAVVWRNLESQPLKTTRPYHLIAQSSHISRCTICQQKLNVLLLLLPVWRGLLGALCAFRGLLQPFDGFAVGWRRLILLKRCARHRGHSLVVSWRSLSPKGATSVLDQNCRQSSKHGAPGRAPCLWGSWPQLFHPQSTHHHDDHEQKKD